jgi:alkylation response protein AidB-like acyl-CoA dehydrogenase
MSSAEPQFQEIRDAVRALCARFTDEYFRALDRERAYPEEFVRALTQAGWLAALIPREYGGAGLGLAEASVIMEEINRCGGNSGACHGQMYIMGALVRHGSDAQGGYGFASEYDVERKFRETRLYQVAPISTNLILSYLAQHVLGLPRSF